MVKIRSPGTKEPSFDSIPPAYHLYRALDVAYSGMSKGLFAMHSAADVHEYIPPESPAAMFKVCRNTMRMLDEVSTEKTACSSISSAGFASSMVNYENVGHTRVYGFYGKQYA